MTDALADIGVIGGTGLTSWLDGAREVPVRTPFGPPSEPPVVGEIAGRRVAFLPRHGRDHRFPPHHVNYRANLWALRALGIRQVLAPSAVGSLRHDLGPGALVIPDQVIDRTWGRAHTVYDQPGPVVHIPFADPYCPHGRATVLATARRAGWAAPEQATLVVINGPRFSTRAESRWHASTGADIVGMTGMPEAAIARELALCYTNVCLVTDLDAGFEEGDAVTQSEVFTVFGKSVERLKSLLVDTIEALPDEEDCRCRHALDGITLPFALP
jgi:5'-methylthioadenosine phosphorylase